MKKLQSKHRAFFLQMSFWRLKHGSWFVAIKIFNFQLRDFYSNEILWHKTLLSLKIFLGQDVSLFPSSGSDLCQASNTLGRQIVVHVTVSIGSLTVQKEHHDKMPCSLTKERNHYLLSNTTISWILKEESSHDWKHLYSWLPFGLGVE